MNDSAMRRRFCAAALGMALAPALPIARAAPRRHAVLTLAGPGAVVSYPLMHMAATGALAEHADRLRFRLWQTPDQLRTLLVNGELDFSAAPCTLPALLYNRGMPVRLLNISVWGILWLVSRDPAVRTFENLAGRELVVPFQRDLPAVLLDTLLEAQAARGLGPVTLRRTRDGQDAIALMLNGQAAQALLVEPMASLLLWRAGQTVGAPALHRGQSLEQAWRGAFPAQPSLPQAGVMAAARVADDAELCSAVNQAYAASARWCVEHPAECAALVRDHLPHLPLPAIETAIRGTRLESRSAEAARPELEALYRLLADRYPQAIGGSLPPAGFYAP
ncbi:ABC transporter substrate-binding protein [Achromobacter agilis]|nr:ABC transporter substrate-binding protein [Achromobacter agilis]